MLFPSSASVDEANAAIINLTNMVQQVLETNQEMARRLKSLESPIEAMEPPPEYPSDLTISDKGSPVFEVSKITDFEHAFEEDLRTSRVYGRTASKANRVSVSSSKFSVGWSFLSTTSLSDVSNVSVVSLPISARELWNHQHYSSSNKLLDNIDTALLNPWYNPPANV